MNPIEVFEKIEEFVFREKKAPVFEAKKLAKNPYVSLIKTILSTRTKEEVTIKATKRLIEKAPTVFDLSKLGEKEIEKLIYPVAFYKNKSKILKKLAEVIIEEYNGKIPNNLEELVKLPGVGRKVANVVLVEAFNQPAIAVDTHVHRISNRLGWVKTKTPEETEFELMKIFPKEYWKRINFVLVAFGQTVCKPQKPKCEICPVKEYCIFSNFNMVDSYLESDLSSRLCMYINEMYNIKCAVQNRFVVVPNQEDASLIIEMLNKDTIMSRYINRVFFINKKTKDLSDIIKDIMAYPNIIIRVQSYPKEIQSKLLELLDNKGIMLSPTQFTHVLYIISRDIGYYYGILPRKYFFKKQNQKGTIVSSAYYKIEEAIMRFRIPISNEWVALDLGAAPGGWVQYLSKRAKLIIAVDPAELLIKDSNIIHIRKKFEDSFLEIEKYAPYNIITCDINQDPREIANVLVRASEFLRKGGYILMTIKLIYKSKKAQEKLIKETIKILNQSYDIVGIKWLLANSKNERCVCGVKR